MPSGSRWTCLYSGCAGKRGIKRTNSLLCTHGERTTGFQDGRIDPSTIESPDSCSLLASNLARPKSDESYLILVIEVFFCHSFHMMEASFSTIPRRIICGSSTFSIGSFSHFRSDTRNIYCCATFLFGQVAFPAWNAQIATEWQSLHDTDAMQLSMFFGNLGSSHTALCGFFAI